jgi:hypothetical protein
MIRSTTILAGVLLTVTWAGAQTRTPPKSNVPFTGAYVKDPRPAAPGRSQYVAPTPPPAPTPNQRARSIASEKQQEANKAAAENAQKIQKAFNDTAQVLPKYNPVQEDPAEGYEANTRGINTDALPESFFLPRAANQIEEPLLRAGKEVAKTTGGDVANDVLGGDADKNTIRKRAAESAAKESAKEAARIAREKVLSPEGNLENEVGWSVSNAKDDFKGAFDTYYNTFINYFNHNVDLGGAFHKLMPPTSNQNSTSEPNAAGWPTDGH